MAKKNIIRYWYYVKRYYGEVDLKNLLTEIHACCAGHGFWDGQQNDYEKMALIHTEISEATEALRKGNPPDKHCPEFGELEVELADAVIRIFDYAAARNLDIAGAMSAKMEFNLDRPFKHGKEC